MVEILILVASESGRIFDSGGSDIINTTCKRVMKEHV